MAVNSIPAGYSTVTPYVVIRGGTRAIDWYKEALNAREVHRSLSPDGRLLHGEIRVGSSVLMLCDEFPEMNTTWKSPETLGGTCVALWIYTEDCDALYSQAVKAGAKGDSAPADMFWGDRFARFTDPFGHNWSVATHKEDLTPEEMQRRQKEYMAQMNPEK